MGFADTSATQHALWHDVTALVADTDPRFDLICLAVDAGELQVDILPGLSPMQEIWVSL